MTTGTTSERRTAKDGREFVVSNARPTDARALARLFTAVRAERRYLVTPPGVRDESNEAYYIREIIVGGRSLVLVAESAGEVVGNVMVLREHSTVQDHVGTLSICVEKGWRDAGVGTALVASALAWAADCGVEKVQLSVFPDNARAIAVYERAGFVTEGLRRRQYRAAQGGYRDELLMAWFAPEQDR